MKRRLFLCLTLTLTLTACGSPAGQGSPAPDTSPSDTPETPYTSDDLNYNDSSSQEMDDPDARPVISSGVENMERYDVIGYPIWRDEAPRIIHTFLESYDPNGKTIAPFGTSASSPMGSGAVKLQDPADSAVWLEGQRFSGGASAREVQSWVDSLNLNG